jgi:hypothetical protein
MKYLLSAVVALSCLPALAQSAYYARPDGGPRYSTTAGAVPGTGGDSCDGLANTPMVKGAGSKQHCAFNDVRYFYTDGSYTTSDTAGAPAWGWIGGANAVYTVAQNLLNNVEQGWRIGQSGGGDNQGLGLQGDPYDSGAPTPPPGTLIRGANYASCTATNKTQLFGGFGVYSVISLANAQNVTLQCIELTRHSQCTKFGSPAVPANCNTGYPLDDYAVNGIVTNVKTMGVVLQDVWIHGFTSRGIIGPIGGTITAKNVDISTNGGAGWDFDDGSGSHNGYGTASVNGLLNWTNVTIEWSGCNQAWPGGGVLSCYGQNNGGYGDAIGTPPGGCIAANVTGSTFRYNVQDGFDFLHNDSGTCPLTFTGNQVYGNMGAVKWGPAMTPAVITGNAFEFNCMRLLSPMTGVPAAFNANLSASDGCTRSNDAFTHITKAGNVDTFTGNTIITYAPVTYDIQCLTGTCAGATITNSDNIVMGYMNPSVQQPGGWLIAGSPTVTRSNNLYFGLRAFTPVTGERVADPLFVSEPASPWTTEPALDDYNIALTTGSPAAGMGAPAQIIGLGTITTTPPPPPTPITPTVPTITWTPPASIVAGTALTSTQLDATASVAGSFTYSPAIGTVLAAGTQTLAVTFIPSNTTDYTDATKSVQITVTAAPPVVVCKSVVLTISGVQVYAGCF